MSYRKLSLLLVLRCSSRQACVWRKIEIANAFFLLSVVWEAGSGKDVCLCTSLSCPQSHCACSCSVLVRKPRAGVRGRQGAFFLLWCREGSWHAGRMSPASRRMRAWLPSLGCGSHLAQAAPAQGHHKSLGCGIDSQLRCDQKANRSHCQTFGVCFLHGPVIHHARHSSHWDSLLLSKWGLRGQTVKCPGGQSALALLKQQSLISVSTFACTISLSSHSIYSFAHWISSCDSTTRCQTSSSDIF